MARFNDKQKKILRLARTNTGFPQGIYKADVTSLERDGLIKWQVSGLGGHQIRYFATDAGMHIDPVEIAA
ncbi:MAG: hypothetical protein ABF968_05830 [Acetobacter sp.]|uniref:hypothetical protein n=1 Tax=Acetobacter sp. TaxID=440 RepID=UPI0039E94C92